VLLDIKLPGVDGYELARRLYARVGLQPRRLFACAHGAPDYPRSRSPAYELPDPQFIAELRRLNGTPHELLADAELMQLMLPLLRADFRLNETYQHRSLPQLSCPVSAYGGTADEDVSEAALTAWRSATRGAFSHRLFAGDHFFIHSATAPLLRQIEVDLGLA